MIVERRTDKVTIRDDSDVVATRVRKNGAYVWQATDPHVQEIINTWKDGSTIDAIAEAIEEANHAEDSRNNQLSNLPVPGLPR